MLLSISYRYPYQYLLLGVYISNPYLPQTVAKFSTCKTTQENEQTSLSPLDLLNITKMLSHGAKGNFPSE